MPIPKLTGAGFMTREAVEKVNRSFEDASMVESVRGDEFIQVRKSLGGIQLALDRNNVRRLMGRTLTASFPAKVTAQIADNHYTLQPLNSALEAQTGAEVDAYEMTGAADVAVDTVVMVCRTSDNYWGFLRRVTTILFDGVCMVSQANPTTNYKDIYQFTQLAASGASMQAVLLHATTPFSGTKKIVLSMWSSLAFNLLTAVSGAAVMTSKIYAHLINADFDKDAVTWNTKPATSVVGSPFTGALIDSDTRFVSGVNVQLEAPWSGNGVILTGSSGATLRYGIMLDFDPSGPAGPNYFSYTCDNVASISDSWIGT